MSSPTGGRLAYSTASRSEQWTWLQASSPTSSVALTVYTSAPRLCRRWRRVCQENGDKDARENSEASETPKR